MLWSSWTSTRSPLPSWKSFCASAYSLSTGWSGTSYRAQETSTTMGTRPARVRTPPQRTAIRGSAPGGRRADGGVVTGRPAHLRLEVADEVRLIEVGELAGHRRGVEGLARGQSLGGLLDPEAPDD